MQRKHHKPEEIVAKLRQVDLLVSRGQNIADADLPDRGERGRLLSMAAGVRRAEDSRSGWTLLPPGRSGALCVVYILHCLAIDSEPIRAHCASDRNASAKRPGLFPTH